MTRKSSFQVRDHFIAQADIGECATYHDFVIATARAVGIKVGRLHSMLLQIFTGRTVFLYRSGGRDVIGSHAVAQNGQYTRTANILNWRGFEGHVVEIWGAADVSGIFFPNVGLAFGNRQVAPALVTVVDLAVAAAEHVGGYRLADQVINLALRGPNISEVDGLAIFALADGIFAQVEIDASGKREGDHQRRRHQVVCAHVGINSAFEVAIPGENGCYNEIVVVDRL